MAMIWFCAMRKASPDDSRRRHQDLVEEILSGDAMRIAGAVPEHLAVGRRHTLELLEPYFSTSSQRFSRIVAARPT